MCRWSIASTGVYSFINAFFSVTAARYFFLFCSLQVSVLCGTLVMGFSKCDVFEDAYEDSGSAIYILGNFVMLFFPLIAAIIITDVTEITLSSVNEVCCSCALGLGVYFIWEFFEDPIDVYGCGNIKSPVVSLIGASCAVILSGILGSIFIIEYG